MPKTYNSSDYNETEHPLVEMNKQRYCAYSDTYMNSVHITDNVFTIVEYIIITINCIHSHTSLGATPGDQPAFWRS